MDIMTFSGITHSFFDSFAYFKYEFSLESLQNILTKTRTEVNRSKLIQNFSPLIVRTFIRFSDEVRVIFNKFENKQYFRICKKRNPQILQKSVLIGIIVFIQYNYWSMKDL